MLLISQLGDQQLVDIFQQCAVLRRKQGMNPFRYAVLLTKTDLCAPWRWTSWLVAEETVDVLEARKFAKEPEQSDSYLAGLMLWAFAGSAHQGYREEVGKRLVASRLMHKLLTTSALRRWARTSGALRGAPLSARMAPASLRWLSSSRLPGTRAGRTFTSGCPRPSRLPNHRGAVPPRSGGRLGHIGAPRDLEA